MIDGTYFTLTKYYELIMYNHVYNSLEEQS